MSHILLVPDLPLERWPSMDRYASRLFSHLDTEAAEFDISMAGHIASLTSEDIREPRRRDSGQGSRRLASDGGSDELRRYLSRYVLYPRRVRHLRGDALHILDHSYAHIVLGERRRPCAVTVHDLFPLITLSRAPAKARDRIRNWFLSQVVEGLKKADSWIVATEWLRGQLSELLQQEERIHVIPYGVDETFFGEPSDEPSLCRARWEIPESAFLILHVGSVDKRKNVPAMMEILEDVRREGMEAWFLQVGGSLTGKQREELSSRGVADFFTQLGPVVERELRNAYHAADMLLFPSHYEGFGFPVLEAMASGLPVVTSGAGGLTEVAGDAAVVIPGRESAPYVDATKRLAENGDWRAELVRRGRERAAKFTWSHTAAETAKVYETLV